MRRDREVLASRIRQIRVERFGIDGLPALARALGLPARTWENYEHGVTVPADVILRFMVLTGVGPGSLLAGEVEQSPLPPVEGRRGGSPRPNRKVRARVPSGPTTAV